MVIVFLGPDGSGKSTVIQHLISDPNPFFVDKYVFHLRPMIFEPHKRRHSSPVTNPHGEVPRGSIMSVLKLFYLLLDYSVGHILDVRLRSRQNSLVIFDRYYHDMLIDPRRYRFQKPMWLAKWIGRIIPKPDMWLLLDSPPEIMYSRKKEVPYEETQRQRKAYLAFIDSQSNAYVVDSSTSIEKTVANVNKIIQAYLKPSF